MLIIYYKVKRRQIEGFDQVNSNHTTAIVQAEKKWNMIMFSISKRILYL